jgi:DNA repair exonuclease SbcCD ATPase subunit
VSMRPVWLMLGFAVVAAAAPLQPLHAAKIVCWTDENGRRACGDRVPPQYARQERQVYDSTGRLIETRPRQKTFEEVEEEQRRVAELEARRKRAQEQAAYDSFLLTTFSSVAELENTRDNRLATLEGRLRLAEESLEQNEKGIEQLKAQIADAEAAGRAAPVGLTRQLQEFEQNLENNRQAVAKLREERATIRGKFDDDIARYRVLSGQTVPSPAAEAPAAGDGG